MYITPIFFLIAWLVIPCSVTAQLVYKIDQHIPVEEKGIKLSMPWGGGLNAAQINTMDLNGDGKQDLVVFDRYASKAFTFLNKDNSYEYTPEYESLLPDNMRHWVLLRDINCDGKKDLFTSDSFGMIAFVNTTKAGSLLSWRPFNLGRPLLAKGVSTVVNIKINGSDIPALDDIDGDGDLDILNVKFVGPSTLQWHKNLSIERTGTCDSMQFERVLDPPNWGNVEECGCGQFAFPGTDCTQRIGGMVQHAGGKALLTLDVDNDGDRDLILSEENCNSLFMLTNSGTSQTASITASTPFPLSRPVSIATFPAAFLEDIDFDGHPDLVVSPNVYGRGARLGFSFQQSVWLYKNTGSFQQPRFTFVKNNFLQDEMIDVGDEASPAFVDYDGDGDQDMFIGNYDNTALGGTLFQYENVGTVSEPSFRLVTDDFAGLSQIGLVGIKPQFVDLNGDENIDLVFTALVISRDTPLPPGTSSIFFVSGKKKNQLDIANQYVENIDFSLRNNENIFVTDIDADGAMDILASRASGALEYWRNTGLPSTLSYDLQDPAFMGLGPSTIAARHIFVMDLNANGTEDMILGDRFGHITIYEDFRSVTDVAKEAISEIIYDPLTEAHIKKNLGGQIHPAAVHLFNTNKPAIAVGTATGGVQLLRPTVEKELDADVIIKTSPNPLTSTETFSVLSTHDAPMQLFTIGGQKILSKPVLITADQTYRLDLTPYHLAAGIYIARFTTGGQTYSRYFVIR